MVWRGRTIDPIFAALQRDHASVEAGVRRMMDAAMDLIPTEVPSRNSASREGDARGHWPRRRSVTIDWLVNEAYEQRFMDNLLVECCDRLRASGMPLGRATVHMRINNPQWLGARMLWRPGLAEAEINLTDYATLESRMYLTSPIRTILEGADEVRARLHATPPGDDPFAIYADMRRDGLTDYVAWPLQQTLGKRHVVTFASDGPDGFSEEDAETLADIVPALALVLEIRLKNRLARTLLETYVGPHASEHILNGSTRRGSGTTVGAAILVCDLRGFTAISELWPRDDVIALLNDYFDTMSDPVERHGGEILKFIGDGMLAIFPLAEPDACAELLAAVSEARQGMASLNAERVARGMDPLGYGIGVHAGDVMYGNIGSRKRLDFTVIGPAVNVAARLETLTKEVRRDALFSSTFVEMLKDPAGLEHVGSHPLHGVGAPVDVYAFKDAGGSLPV